MKGTQPLIPGSNILSLTGVRLFAALGVLLFHFSEINSDKNQFFYWGFLDPLIKHGAIGVDVFFILSGFILAHVYRERFRGGKLNQSSYLAFIQNRFARIYPVHIVTMFVMYGVYLIGRHMGVMPHHTKVFTLYSLFANITMMHAWLPGVSTINGPAWSISAEWFAYLLFPFLCVFLLRRSVWWPVAIMVITLVGSGMVLRPHPLVLISLEFPFGVALYEMTIRRKFVVGSWGQWLSLVLVVFSTYVLSATDSAGLDTDPRMRMGIMVATAFAFASLAQSGGILSRFLSWAPIVYGGEISYSIYMCHWSVWAIIHRGLERMHRFQGVSHAWFMLLGFVVSIPVAMCAYHFVELPGRSALRSISLRRTKRESVVAL